MDISTLIRKRRSVFPKFYKEGAPVERAVLDDLLESANWAPTHRLTQPWRFQVFHSPEARAALGHYLAEYYRTHTDPALFSEEKYRKNAENPEKSGAVIAICMQRDPDERVPEFEEIASVAMAVQNMWLHCAEMGLGCYWSTPKAILEANAFLGLEEGARCLGLFYLGWHDMPEVPGRRDPVADKTIWR